MIEIRGDKKVLITPISEEDLADIKIGDIVWLDGELMTCRDVAHRRLVEYGRELPYDIKDKAIFHAGPIVRKIEGTEDDYEMVSVGPTTSMRMEKFEYEFTKLTGVRVIVARNSCDTGHDPKRYLHINILEIILCRPLDSKKTGWLPSLQRYRNF